MPRKLRQTVTSNAERVALALHILGLARRVRSVEGPSPTTVVIPAEGVLELPAEPVAIPSFDEVEMAVLMLNRLELAARTMERVRWPRGFEPARRAAAELRKAWAPLSNLRHSIEHVDERLVDFGHLDRGRPLSRRLVRGEEIPFLQSGFVGGAGGLDRVQLLGKSYQLTDVMIAVRTLDAELTDLLLEKGDSTEHFRTDAI